MSGNKSTLSRMMSGGLGKSKKEDSKKSATTNAEPTMSSVVMAASAAVKDPNSGELQEEIRALKEKNAALVARISELNQFELDLGDARKELVALKKEEHRDESKASTPNAKVSIESNTDFAEDSQQLETIQFELQRVTLAYKAANEEANTLKQEMLQFTAQVKDRNQQVVELSGKIKAYELEIRDINVGFALERSTWVKQQSASSNENPTSNVPTVFFTNMEKNQRKAERAISDLRSELSGYYPPTIKDNAIKGIVDCLQNGMKQADPQAYFDKKKDDLNTNLRALRGNKSLLNTAINAIMTVFAVLSIVGIPALLWMGTLQNNKAKNGSEFAFCMFGAKQKAERDIHEVMQSISLGA